MYIFARTEEERSSFRTSLIPLATKYEEYLSFVTVDSVEYEQMAIALGLGQTGFLALQNPVLGQIFPYQRQKAITAEIVEEFVLDIVQGTVKPLGSDGEGVDDVKHTEL